MLSMIRLRHLHEKLPLHDHASGLQPCTSKVCIIGEVPKKDIKESSRLTTLDHIRGFFIIVIIVDHLARWPSLFALISGQGLLWVTAAEGFVIISGLLVGYVRGFKNKTVSMMNVSKKLVGRAALLYLWSIIATIGYTAIIWYVPLVGGAPVVPFAIGDWWQVITHVISFQQPFVWVHFLTLYALFLAASPIAIFLLRRNLAWLVVALSLGLLVLGWQTHVEALQWQALFFIPSVAGYYLESIRSYWNNSTHAKRRTYSLVLVGVTGVTIVASAIAWFLPALIQTFADVSNAMFAKDTISIWRLAIAFVWFIGFLIFFDRFRQWISAKLGWLLIPIGTRSLTAYILHGIAIIGISFLTVAGENIVINTILGIIAIMSVWGLLRIPLVQKIIPR